MELKNETKIAIVNQKLTSWSQQQYSLSLDAKVAKIADDENMLTNVKTQLKTVIAAIDILTKELDELSK